MEVKGLKEINAKLSELADGLKGEGIKKKLNTIGGMVLNTIEESFASQKSPFGETWDVRKKSKVGQSTLILRDEGNLSDKWMVNATNTEVTVGNNSAGDYGMAHQWGTDKAGRGKKTTIPKRSFLPINEAGNLEQSLQEDIIAYLDDAIGKTLS